jgi:hypothetical protein
VKTYAQLKEALAEKKLIYPVINARSPADQEFADAHPVQVIPDPEGNKDDVFAATNIQKDTTVRANKWTGDDDADDAQAETGLDTAGTYHNKKLDEAAFNVKHGAFHRWLGKSEDSKITSSDIKKGLAAGGHAAKMAEFAKASKHFVHEETDDITEAQLMELSKKVLGSYIKKASSDLDHKSHESGKHFGRSQETNDKDEWRQGSDKAAKAQKRLNGIKQAVNRVVEEKVIHPTPIVTEVEIVEEALTEAAIKELLENYHGVLKKHGFSHSGGSFVKSNQGRVRVDEKGKWTHTSAHGERKTGDGHETLDKHLGSLHESEQLQLQEIAKSTLKSYVKKARADNKKTDIGIRIHNSLSRTNSYQRGKDPHDPEEVATRVKHSNAAWELTKKESKRKKGIKLATKKLKEESSLIQEQAYIEEAASYKALGPFHSQEHEKLVRAVHEHPSIARHHVAIAKMSKKDPNGFHKSEAYLKRHAQYVRALERHPQYKELKSVEAAHRSKKV